MKNLLRLEEASLALLSIYMLYSVPFGLPWWGYILAFFVPDIGMLGYLVNNKVGALTYNICHLYTVAVAFILLGTIVQIPLVLFIGWMLLLHISVDRVLGYGLKYLSGFNDTHLGPLK